MPQRHTVRTAFSHSATVPADRSGVTKARTHDLAEAERRLAELPAAQELGTLQALLEEIRAG